MSGCLDFIDIRKSHSTKIHSNGTHFVYTLFFYAISIKKILIGGGWKIEIKLKVDAKII